jgi:hypothetical protein
MKDQSKLLKIRQLWKIVSREPQRRRGHVSRGLRRCRARLVVLTSSSAWTAPPSCVVTPGPLPSHRHRSLLQGASVCFNDWRRRAALTSTHCWPHTLVSIQFEVIQVSRFWSDPFPHFDSSLLPCPIHFPTPRLRIHPTLASSNWKDLDVA